MKFTCAPLFLVTVCVAGFLYAQPGTGIRLGEATVLVPSVDLSYNYDDNVNLRRRATNEGGETLDENTSDTYYKYMANLSLTRFAGNRSFRAGGWYGEEFYQDFSELDGKNYGGRAGFFWARPGGETTLDLNGGYEHAVDRVGSYEDGPDGTNSPNQFENVAERVERDIASFDAELNQKLGQDLGTAFLFNYYDTAYDEELYNDRTSYDYQAELNYRLSPKTQPYARVGLGIDDDEGFVDDAEKPFYLLGVRYTPTEKTSIDVAVGYESYTRTPYERSFTTAADGTITEEKTPGEEIEDSDLKYTANIRYQATPKTTLHLRGRNGYDSVASGTASSRRENNVSLILRHQTTARINQSFMINWREDEYLSPVTVGGVDYDEKKETLRYQYQLNYSTVKPWLSFYGKVSYEDGTSEIPGDDYTQTLLSLGAKLRY